ncbi:MAG TPA: PEP-CTERM sorting domain-containing protein [Vicinamibacterales bacterium]|nr:PEP-CTERM sorting domain-containing protein [Vicinamibacterales bacterium]
MMLGVTGLLAATTAAQADPIQYLVTGQIRDVANSTIYELTGSFLLSDPTITYDIYGTPTTVPPATPSPTAENLSEFSITNFNLQSTIFNATGGTGQLSLKALDYVDRYAWLTFGGYQSSASAFGVEAMNVAFIGGTIYQQPAAIVFGVLGQFALVGPSGAPRYSVNVTAERARVPEPGTLALLALGAAGFAAHRRRRRSSGTGAV